VHSAVLTAGVVSQKALMFLTAANDLCELEVKQNYNNYAKYQITWFYADQLQTVVADVT